MDLTGFKKLTKEQYEALSEREQVKYELQLEAYNEQKEKEVRDAAAKEAKEAAEKAIADAKVEADKERDEAITAAIKVVKDEYDTKIEKAQAEMSRAKEAQNKMRSKGLMDELDKAFESESAQKALKEMASGAKSGIITNFEVKAPADSMSVPAGAFRDQWVGDVAIPSEPVHVRNIVPVSSTDVNMIKFLQWQLGPDGNLIDSVTPGGLKPQFELIPVPKSAPVVKIAGHITYKDEFVEDIPTARQTIIRQLPEALFDKEDAKMLVTGMGGDEDILSIWEQATAWTPGGTVTAGSNNWDKMVRSMTMIARAKRRATAAWISPEAYQELLINKNDNGTYNYPIVMGNDNILRVGGLPIFYNNVFEADQGIVGDFSGGAEIFQKKGVEVRFSREHAENFTHNLTTVIVEVREAFAVYTPDAFIKIDNFNAG